ncbi:AMP-dependent synthetase, partial [Halomonas litopenaei]|nr:AMP-dependent synthetase [Halomonas litopenaei]
LEDLKARAIIVEAGYDGPARAAANRFNMTVIELTATEPAGTFTLSTDVTGDVSDAVPTADDVALILHTSGTTSRPKIVPLLQSNVAASAENIRASLALTPEDCCLNVMPLFHIHGLIAAVSASLAAGASISCAPGFDALKFYG